MKTIKQVIGIDISKDTFHACLGSMDENRHFRVLRQGSFANTGKGFKEFTLWWKKLSDCSFVMEATGVYYEELAYFLWGNQQALSVLLPNKTRYFAKSLDIKTKTDKVDAAMLSRIGLERNLDLWQPPSPLMKEIKSLCRELRSLKQETVRIRSRLHAYEHSHKPLKRTMTRLKQQLRLVEKQMVEVEKELRLYVKQDTALSEKISNIELVKGLSFQTIITVIAETNGFATIENAKQLASYSGLDVVMNQSGQYNGKTRISRKGNRHIRSALYLPAMSAVRSNLRFKQFYESIKAKKSSGKVGIIAVARKLLVLIYTLWTKNTIYNPLLNLSET